MATVTGPTSSTDTALARWDGTSGSVIQDSSVTLDGSGNMTGVGSLGGSVTTTTQSPGDNSTKIATTAYVDTGLSTLALDDLTDCSIDYADESMSLGYGGATGPGGTALGWSSKADTRCTAVGSSAMSNGGGGDSVAVGYHALLTSLDGSGNTAVGTQALLYMTSGESNTAIGAFCGENVIGANNTLIGYGVAPTLATGSNNIVIGVDMDVPASNINDYINIGNIITGVMTAPALADGFTATTQSPGDNSTNIATTAYVDAAVAAGGGAPTYQYLTSGSSATYTTPAGCKAIHLEMVGGGGGGGASVTNTGSAGGDTIFNGIHAAGGGGGPVGGAVAAGGTGGTGGTGSATLRQSGQPAPPTSNVGNNLLGASGGSLFGLGLPGPTATGTAGTNAPANSGAGGTGGNNNSNNVGGGGGGGEYVVINITSPASTYTYTVGAGGNGGAAGTKAGGNGGSGLIKVTEYY